MLTNKSGVASVSVFFLSLLSFQCRPLQIPLKTLRASGYDEKALLTEVDLKQLVNDFVYWPKIDKWEDMVTGGLTMEDYLQTNADDD